MTTETDKTPKHQWLDADGNVTDKIESASGIRYTTEAGDVFDYQVTDDAMMMLAAFGARTLVTNTVSSFYGPLPKGAPKGSSRPRKPDAPDTDLAGLTERFGAIVAGDWGAERGGAGGVGYNLDDLCEALRLAMQELQGTAINVAKVRANLDNGGTYAGNALDAKAYRKAIYTTEGVAERYAQLRAAKAAVTNAADVTGDFV